jgi:hypothetical protein
MMLYKKRVVGETNCEKFQLSRPSRTLATGERKEGRGETEQKLLA